MLANMWFPASNAKMAFVVYNRHLHIYKHASSGLYATLSIIPCNNPYGTETHNGDNNRESVWVCEYACVWTVARLCTRLFLRGVRFFSFPQPFVLRCSAEGKRAKTNKARCANKGAAEPAGLSPALTLSFSLSHQHLLIQRHCKPAVQHQSPDALRSG